MYRKCYPNENREVLTIQAPAAIGGAVGELYVQFDDSKEVERK